MPTGRGNYALFHRAHRFRLDSLCKICGIRIKQMNKIFFPSSSEFTNWSCPAIKDETDIELMFRFPGYLLNMLLQSDYYGVFEAGIRAGEKANLDVRPTDVGIAKAKKIKDVPTLHANKTTTKNVNPGPSAKNGYYVLPTKQFSFPPINLPQKILQQKNLPRKNLPQKNLPQSNQKKGGTGGLAETFCALCLEDDIDYMCPAIAGDNVQMRVCAPCAFAHFRSKMKCRIGNNITNISNDTVDVRTEYDRFQYCFNTLNNDNNPFKDTFEEFEKTLDRSSTPLPPLVLPPIRPRPLAARPFAPASSNAVEIARQETTPSSNQAQAHVVINGNQITARNFSRLYIRAAMLDMRSEIDGSFLGAYGYLLLYSWIRADIKASAQATIEAALSSFAFTIGFVTGTGLIDKMFGDTTKIPLLHVLKNLIKIPATVLHIIPSILYWQERSQTISTDNDNRHVIEEMYVNAFGRQFFDDIKFTHIAAVQLDRALVNLSKEKAWLQSQRDGPRVTSEPEYLKVPCVFELIPGMGQVNESSLDVTQTKNFTLFGYYPGVMSLILSRTPLLRGGGKLAGIWLGMGVTFLCALVPAFW